MAGGCLYFLRIIYYTFFHIHTISYTRQACKIIRNLINMMFSKFFYYSKTRYKILLNFVSVQIILNSIHFYFIYFFDFSDLYYNMIYQIKQRCFIIRHFTIIGWILHQLSSFKNEHQLINCMINLKFQ